MRKLILIVLAFISVSANAADFSFIIPNTVKVQAEHISSAAQHFGSNPSNFGADLTEVVAHWNLPYHSYVELGQGYCLDGCVKEIKFTTTIRLGFQWQLK